jgi:hypothetical protein
LSQCTPVMLLQHSRAVLLTRRPMRASNILQSPRSGGKLQALNFQMAEATEATTFQRTMLLPHPFIPFEAMCLLQQSHTTIFGLTCYMSHIGQWAILTLQTFCTRHAEELRAI